MKISTVFTLSLFALIPALVFSVQGTFQGTGERGKNGTVTVSVTVDNSRITDITVDSTEEDKTYASDRIIKAIVKNNNINVDIVSGASYTSRATLTAIQAALGTNAAMFMGEKIKPMR